jgi:hypothetical protein
LKQRAAYKTSDFTIYGKMAYCENTVNVKSKQLKACGMSKKIDQTSRLLNTADEQQVTTPID